MTTALLAFDVGLSRAGRVPPLAAADAREVRVAEVVVLLLTGAVAAALTNLVRLRLGIPGSSIVFAAFPMALGLALVPRRGAGSVMAAGALLTTGVLGAAGVRLDGLGAQTSLLATGPLLDLAVRWTNGGWRMHLALVLACGASNTLAFIVRAAAKLSGVPGVAVRHGGGGGGGGFGGGLGGGHGGGLGGGGGGRLLFDLWLPQAVWTYAAAGIVAGLVSAAFWFHYRERRRAAP